MGFRKVAYVDKVPDGGRVRGIVVGAKDRQVGTPS
jgi:hypothetical protein